MLVTLTGFADNALMLPLAAAIGLWLLASRAPRAALWWTAALFLCGSLTAVLKIFFWGCPPLADLRSPSGHTSLGTLVYGGMALIIAVESGHWRRHLAIGVGAVLVTAIAVSRLLLDAHSVPEVLLGLLIGVASLALFVRGYRRFPPPEARLVPLLVGAAVLMSLLHGSELRAEELLHRLTGYFGIACRHGP